MQALPNSEGADYKREHSYQVEITGDTIGPTLMQVAIESRSLLQVD